MDNEYLSHMKLNEIENCVLKFLTDFLPPTLESGASDHMWTQKIMGGLVSLAENFDCRASCSHGGARTPEWLFDMAWWRVDVATLHLRRVALVLECEWKLGFDEIQYDFQKLMVARAENRIMIFQSRKDSTANEYIDDLILDSKGFDQRVKGDRYLFLVYSRESQSFIVRHHIHA